MGDEQKQGPLWTFEEIAQLRQMARKNIPAQIIAFKLKRTVAEVQSKAHAEHFSLAPANRSPYS